MLIRKALLPLLVAVIVVVAAGGAGPVAAQSLSAEDIAAFKSLPPDQRKALMQQYAPDLSQEDAALVGGDSPAGVPVGDGPKADVGPSAPAGHSSLVTASTLQPGDAVFIEMTRRGGGEPPDAMSQDFLRAVNEHNPFDIKPDGALHLPGVPAVRVAGLSVASAEKVLSAQPVLRPWALHLTMLPPVGGVPKRVAPFGHEFFQHGSGRQGLTPSLPVPKDYVLGPDDQIQIELFGNKAARYQRNVDRDGILNVPEFGPIAVMGRRFDDVRHELEVAAKTKLIGTEVHVTMGRLRSMQVFVLGDVEHPGAFNVSSLSTVLNVLMDAGGPSPVGSMRGIQLRRTGAPARTVDLYDVLLKGDRQHDYSLQPGDVVFVPPLGRTVEVGGEVRRPAIYEVSANATLAELIQLAGGLNSTAYSGEITVDRVTRTGVREALHVDLAKGQAHSLKVSDGDRLQIARVIDSIENTVEVAGWVQRPRTVPWRDGVRVSDLVGSVEALERKPDLEYGLIARETGPERRMTFLSFVPREMFAGHGTEADPELELRDVVLFFAKDESRAGLLEPQLRRVREEYHDGQPPPVVDIAGAVRLPGEFPLSKGMTLGRLLVAAGGEREPDLDYGLIAREEGEDRHLAFQSFSPRALLEGDAKVASIPLQARDRVILFSRTGEREGALKGLLERVSREAHEGSPPRIVSITGYVRFPGQYPLTDNLTVRELIRNAGGEREAANTAAELAHFEINNRETRVAKVDSLRLDSEGALSTVLGPYDVLMVRSIERADTSQWSVEISGAVRFPGTYVIGEHQSLVDVLKRAGGFAADANPEGLALVREEARRLEQAQLDAMTERLSHDLSVKLISTSNAVPTSASAQAEGKEQMLAAQALLAELRSKRAIGRVALPAEGIAQLKAGERYDIPMLGGDRIVVPRRAGTVSVVGEVLSPGAFSVAAGTNLTDFIRLAGGTTKDADERRAYVVGPDGLAQPLGRFMNRHLRDGDTVVVPTDLKKLPPLPMWAAVTQILSNMVITAAAIKRF